MDADWDYSASTEKDMENTMSIVIHAEIKNKQQPKMEIEVILCFFLFLYINDTTA
jgi:hypothetical protein